MNKSAQAEINTAWVAYQKNEKHGLEFGRVCCEWRNAIKSKGGYGTKGKGLVQLLDELSIPKSTAYWWMNRYKASIGTKQYKTNFNPAGTRGYRDKLNLNLFIRRLHAIGGFNPNSPFPRIVDSAYRECDSYEMAEVTLQGLERAIKRLSEYHIKFKERMESLHMKRGNNARR